jgi:5-dehydro-4-deoxyglucarate dehydratase
VPSLQFWKDGQGDTRKYQRIMQHVGGRLAWLGGLGDDCVPAYFAIGVQAYTSSISNLAPQLSLDLAEAAIQHDSPRLDRLMQTYVHPLYALRERQRGYEVAMTKAAMEMLGRKAGPVRPPLSSVRPQDLQDLKEFVAQTLVSAGYPLGPRLVSTPGG